MNKEDDPQCYGKTVYLSGSKAHENLKRRHKKHRFRKQAGCRDVRVYRCRICGHYHIGSSFR